MTARTNYLKTSPQVYEAMMGLERAIAASGLDARLVRLVKLRVSQINGCAYCIERHVEEALAAGEALPRLYFLDAQADAPVYSDAERSALAFAEAVTRMDGGVGDEIYAEARRHFSDPELASLALAVVAINGWNRLNVAFRVPPPRALRAKEG